jgi:hypothetical protein
LADYKKLNTLLEKYRCSKILKVQLEKEKREPRETDGGSLTSGTAILILLNTKTL